VRAKFKLEESVKIVARAEQVADAHAADISKQEAAVAAAQAANVNRLSAMLAAADPLAAMGIESPALAEAESLLSAARSRSSTSSKALAALRADQARAQAELNAADLAVENAAIGIYVAQVETIAREATRLRAEAGVACERVAHATAGYDQWGHGIQGKLFSALKNSTVIQTAGDPPSPPERLPSDWGLPHNETSAARRSAAGIKPWADLLDSLLRGDFTKASDSKAAA